VPQTISLSALLNAIDGAFSRDGRVLFMTTNFKDKIDPALLRAGRSDRRIEVGPLDDGLVSVMCSRFLQNPRDAAAFAKEVKAPIPAAELQERLLETRFDGKSHTNGASPVQTDGISQANGVHIQ
jgi:mitochondrial chaperone BCS1